MTRLTKRNTDGSINLYISDRVSKKVHNKNEYYGAIQKLIKYEDLEESGKIINLYIGDNIYFRVKGMNQFGEYVDFIQTQKIRRIDIDKNGILYCTASVKFIEYDIGKKVFLTREEAEEKLKEIRDNG